MKTMLSFLKRPLFILSLIFLFLPSVNKAQLFKKAPKLPDSLLYEWHHTKIYNYQRISIIIGGGTFLPFAGNMIDENYKVFPNGFSFYYGFSGGPSFHSESVGLSAGMKFRLNRQLDISLWVMPGAHKCFDGGKGTSDSYFFFIFPNTDIYNGSAVFEELVSNNFMSSVSYNIVPYKNLHFIGFDIKAGGGIMVNQFDLKTTLWAFDTTRTFNGSGYTTTYLKESLTYNKKKVCFGGIATIQTSIYLSKYFSIYYLFSAGIGSKMKIPEQSLTVGRTTAKLPAHYEYFGGVSNTFGIGIHLIKGK